MSLTSCLTCGHDCAKNAKACPHCGQLDPTNLPPTISEKIQKYNSISLLVIGLLLFVTWVFASPENFFVVALAGVGIYVLICFSGVLLSLFINWKRTVGVILFLIPAGQAIEFYGHPEYLKAVIAAILSLPGLYIALANLESK